MSGKKKRMAAFKLGEISMVDTPAQEHARLVLVKRADDVSKKTKTEGGQAYPASDFAYVPDPEKPSTWKLRLTSTPGGSPDPGIVGAAAAALGPGYRGNKVQIPTADRSAVVARVRRAWRKANPDKEDSEMPSGIKKSDGDINVCDLIAKMYVDPSDGAMSFAEVLDLEMQSHQYYEMMEAVCPLVYAMETSLKSIAGDASYSLEERMNMMRSTVESFMSQVREKMAEAEDMITEMAYKLEEEPEMAKTIKQLNEENERLAAELKEAKKASGTANTEELDALKAQLEEVNKQLETLKSERDAAVAKADLSDAERTFVETLDAENASEFMKMSKKARASFMKTADETDETLVVGSRTVRKSIVGEDVFEVMKAQEERLKLSEEIAKKERDDRITTQLQKRAEAELNNLPGSVAEKVDVLKAVSGLDEAVVETLNKIFKAADESLSGAYTSFGHKDGRVTDIHKARNSRIQKDRDTDFMKKVETIKREERVSGSEAMTIARKRYPDEYAEFAGKDEPAA